MGQKPNILNTVNEAYVQYCVRGHFLTPFNSHDNFVR